MVHPTLTTIEELCFGFRLKKEGQLWGIKQMGVTLGSAMAGFWCLLPKCRPLGMASDHFNGKNHFD